MVEVMKIMETSFKRSHVHTATLSAAGSAWDLLKDEAIIFITSTIVWPQVKQEGGEHSPIHQQKLD